MVRYINPSEPIETDKEGCAIRGDHILVQCRKRGKWIENVHGSSRDRCFRTDARKDAYAVIRRTYTNKQK